MAITDLYYIYENITLTQAAYFSKNLQCEFHFINSRARHILPNRAASYIKYGVGVSSILLSLKIRYLVHKQNGGIHTHAHARTHT
jgi:hypothetical protein